MFYLMLVALANLQQEPVALQVFDNLHQCQKAAIVANLDPRLKSATLAPLKPMAVCFQPIAPESI